MNFDQTDEYQLDDPEFHPATVMSDFRKKYGFDTRFPALDGFQPKTYFRIAERVDGEWVARWRLVGVASSGEESLFSGFSEFLSSMDESNSNEKLFDTPRIIGIMCVNYGEARFRETDNMGNLNCPDDLPESVRALVRDQLTGEISGLPLVNLSLITVDGLMSTALIGHDGRIVYVEEMCQSASEGDNVAPEGEIDNQLVWIMAFMVMIQTSVVLGHGMGVEGLLNTAMSRSDTVERNAMMGFLLRLLGQGVESGILGFGGEDD